MGGGGVVWSYRFIPPPRGVFLREQSVLLDLLFEHSDIAGACAASGLTNASFYRRVHDLRMHLRMFGLREVG